MSDIGVEIGGEVTGFRRAMQEMVQSAKDGSRSIESSFGGLSRVFDGVRGHIAALGVAVSAGSFVALIKGSIDAADHLHDMAQRTGMSVEVLSGLKLVADQSGTSLEGLGTAFKKLSVNLVDASAGNKEVSSIFKALGISGTNAQVAMYRLADIMSTLPDGAQKTALAVKLLGRAGEEMIPLLNQGGEELRKMIEHGQKLAGVTSEMTEQADQFNDQLAELKVQSQATGIAMAKYALPALNDIAAAMREAAKEGGILNAIWVGLGGAGAAMFTDEFAGAEKKIRNLQFEIDRLRFNKEQLVGGGLLQKWLYGNNESIDAEIKSKMEQIEALKRAMAQPPKQPDTPKKPAVDVTKILGAGNRAASVHKAEGPDSYMQYYEGALDQEKRLASERDALRGYSKQEELAFWQMLIANADLKGKDRLSIERKISGLIVDIKRTEAKQRQELDGEGIRSGETLALGRVEAERAAAQVSLDLNQMNKSQFLALEESFEQQRFEIQRAALEERTKLLEKDPNTNPVEFARIKNQILELEQQHELKRMQLQGQAAVESGQIWNDLRDRMGGLWDQGMQAMLNGTLTWRNAMRAVGAQVVAWFATDVVGKQVKTWLLGEAAKTGATQTGTAMRLVIEAGAALKSVGIWAAAAIKNIMNMAWEAMSAAWKAVVGIPVIGPVLAPIAAGAAFAGVSKLAKNVMSAERGYDIPRGINPLTQLHEEEMVLPKEDANVIRSLRGSGAGSDGTSAGGGDQFHVTIYSPDTGGMRRLLLDNQGALVEAMKAATRNFRHV